MEELEAKAVEPPPPEVQKLNRDDVTFDFETDAALRSTLGAIDKQYVPQGDVPRRIHILGTGNIGLLVAHSLRSITDPPPTSLIFHRHRLLEAWEKSDKVVTVKDGPHRETQGGYDVELKRDLLPKVHRVSVENPVQFYEYADENDLKPHEAAALVARRQRDQGALTGPMGNVRTTAHTGEYAFSDEPIHNLIVATKSNRTIAALEAIKYRLSRESTICFLQNGMGLIDDINKELFRDEATRPNYIQGIVSHGAHMVSPAHREENPFYVVHAGHGTIALGAIPREKPTAADTRSQAPTGAGSSKKGKLAPGDDKSWSPSSRYLLRTLTRCPSLCAVGFTSIELHQQQLEKLAMNCIINPLTVLLDARNGVITYNFELTRVMRLMLAEISLVIRSLPELKGIPNVPFRFSAERLETLVIGIANKTANNISSMLADVRAGRPTEIDYINGYIVKRGEELGIKCLVNYAIMQTVNAKRLMAGRELQDIVPMANDPVPLE
jgi:2-dehydropantoate 2-reductase